jgi:hypothetical protein
MLDDAIEYLKTLQLQVQVKQVVVTVNIPIKVFIIKCTLAVYMLNSD